MPRVVDDYIEPAIVRDDLVDAGLHRCLRLHVELDGAQIDAVRLCIGRDFGHPRRIAPLGFTHRSVNGMARLGQSLGTEQSEAARCAGYQNDLFHEMAPSIQCCRSA